MHRLMNTLVVLSIALFMVACSNTTGTAVKGSSQTDTKGTQINADSIATLYLNNITATVDPAFEYAYEKTKFVPPEGKVLYIMGQDTATISTFADGHGDDAPPAGWSVYWGVSGPGGVIRLNDESLAKQFGYGGHKWLTDKFENAVIQSALWVVGRDAIPANILNGTYDTYLDTYVTYAKSIKRPMYLRIGYEFDGMHNELEPTDYVKLYRYIHDYITKAGVTNIAYVWHSYVAAPYKGYAVTDWYPGDDYVDWFGVSLFGQMYTKGSTKEVQEFLELAKTHKKPVMIAESAPAGKGVVDWENFIWEDWYAHYFNLIIEKNIKAFSYINCDWNSFPGFAEMNWMDSRIESNAAVEKAFIGEVSKSRYLKSSPELYEILGYSE